MLCTTVPLVQGYHSNSVFGSQFHPVQNNDPYPNWFNWYELPAQSATANYIAGLHSQTSQNWVLSNNYGSSTTNTNVYSLMSSMQNNAAVDFIAAFHVGDAYSTKIGAVDHYAYYGNSGTSDAIIDANLYPNTGTKNKFTFLWTCINGGLIANHGNSYGGWDPATGAVGMPYAWTHKTNMGLQGYKYPDSSGYAYIGFANTSKNMCDTSNFVQGNYGEFCRQFYYNLLVNRYSVSVSLDKATNYVRGSSQYNFDSTDLYNGYYLYSNLHQINSTCSMKVFGDGSMVVPY